MKNKLLIESGRSDDVKTQTVILGDGELLEWYNRLHEEGTNLCKGTILCGAPGSSWAGHIHHAAALALGLTESDMVTGTGNTIRVAMNAQGTLLTSSRRFLDFCIGSMP